MKPMDLKILVIIGISNPLLLPLSEQVSILAIETNLPLLCARWAAARTIKPVRALAAEALTLERKLKAEG
jgi:hypothetical protein